MQEKSRTQSPSNTMVKVDIVENKGACQFTDKASVKHELQGEIINENQSGNSKSDLVQ